MGTKGSTSVVVLSNVPFSTNLFPYDSKPGNWEWGLLAEKLLSLQPHLFSLVYPPDIFSIQSCLPVSQPPLVHLLVDKCLQKVN